MNDSKKIVLIGTGLVGMSFAYALLNNPVCDELVLLDINKERAIGEAMDLNHGLAFSGGHMRIYAGDYEDCKDADIVCICAGAKQEPGESRIALLGRNRRVFESVLRQVLASAFSGIFLVATNPVDIMTRLVYELSGFPAERVIGTGTTLDTARLRYLLGGYFCVDPRNVHAYVMGEHGDSEFVPWSQALIGTKSVLTICEENTARFNLNHLTHISEEVKHAAAKIIDAKGATYYGIGMALVRITKAIFGNENSVLTISSLLSGEYGEQAVYVGAPCILGRSGVLHTMQLALTEEERKTFRGSCDFLRKTYRELSEVPVAR